MQARSTRGGSVYQPELDGIRAFAVLAVMVFHSTMGGLWGPRYRGGFLGVDVFFVLSGYLITTLLVAEWDRAERVRVRKFYMRRALRLLPALVAMLVFGGVVAMLVTGPFPRPYLKSAVMSVSYVANWFQARRPLTPIGHTWSLAIEEQYYLVWPALLIVGLRVLRAARERLAVLVLLAGFAMGVVRFVLVQTHHPFIALLSTVSRPDGLLIGSALALALAGNTPRLRMLLARRDLAIVAVAAVGVATLVLRTDQRPMYFGGLSLFNLCTAFVIGHISVARESSVARALSVRPLPFVGRISYGLYLYHLPVLYLLSDYPPRRHGIALFATFFVITFATAIVSFAVLESPFLKLKSRFEVDRTKVAGEAAVQ